MTPPVGLLLLAQALPAAPVPPAPHIPAVAQEMVQAAGRQLAQDRFGPTTVDASEAVSFVESATTVPWTTLSLSSSGTFDRYEFPATLRVSNPFGVGLPEMDGWKRRFRLAELSGTWAPLQVTQKTVEVEGKKDVRLKGAAARTVVAGFKLPLFGTGEIEDGRFGVNTALGHVPFGADLNTLNAIMEPAIKVAKKGVASQVRGTLVLNYALDSRPDSGDSVTAGLALSRGGLGAHNLEAGGFFGVTRFRRDGQAEPFEVRTVRASLTIPTVSQIWLAVEVASNHYVGDGFRGIPGVLDPGKTHEINLGQTLILALPSGQRVQFAVKELHLRTGDVDMALSVGFGLRLK